MLVWLCPAALIRAYRPLRTSLAEEKVTNSRPGVVKFTMFATPVAVGEM